MKAKNDKKDLSPHIAINVQYVKDLSFENPAAPDSLGAQSEPPKIELALDLCITKLNDSQEDESSACYSVAMTINASSKNTKQDNLFEIELVYVGIFTLLNIPDDQHQMVLAVRCSEMIFPYARKIISDTTQDGGFQPLMIDPIDFGMLYHKKLLEENQVQGNS